MRRCRRLLLLLLAKREGLRGDEGRRGRGGRRMGRRRQRRRRKERARRAEVVRQRREGEGAQVEPAEEGVELLLLLLRRMLLLLLGVLVLLRVLEEAARGRVGRGRARAERVVGVGVLAAARPGAAERVAAAVEASVPSTAASLLLLLRWRRRPVVEAGERAAKQEVVDAGHVGRDERGLCAAGARDGARGRVRVGRGRRRRLGRGRAGRRRCHEREQAEGVVGCARAAGAVLVVEEQAAVGEEEGGVVVVLEHGSGMGGGRGVWLGGEGRRQALSGCCLLERRQRWDDWAEWDDPGLRWM